MTLKKVQLRVQDDEVLSSLIFLLVENDAFVNIFSVGMLIYISIFKKIMCRLFSLFSGIYSIMQIISGQILHLQ